MNDETGMQPLPDGMQDIQPRESAESELTGALSSTLDNLNQSIQLMETIVSKLEAGDADWEESVRLLSEANELAMQSSQKLDRVVQEVVYGSDENDARGQDPIPGI